MVTTVVHVKRGDYTVKIDRTTRYGNPYVIGRDGTREQVIVLFDRHLDRMQPDRLAKMLWALKDETLGCHCKPLACHGDVWVRRCDELTARPRP